MRLRFSVHSPYVRKVRVVAHELGVSHRIEQVPTTLRTQDPAFWSENPLAKIPVLTLEDGASYADSTVICEYLDATFGGHRLLPLRGDARWRALTTIALADGVTDAGMLARQELLRPPELKSAEHFDFQLAKVARGLDRLQETVAEASDGESDAFDLPRIATACCLGWLELRFGSEYVFTGRQPLSGWYRRVCERPSMQTTRPDHHA